MLYKNEMIFTNDSSVFWYFFNIAKKSNLMPKMFTASYASGLARLVEKENNLNNRRGYAFCSDGQNYKLITIYKEN